MYKQKFWHRIASKMQRIYQTNKNQKIFKSYGDNSFILKPSRIIGGEYIEIGKNVSIFHGLRIEAIDEWNLHHFTPTIIIEDNVGIQQNCHITCAEEIAIGKCTSILPSVMITDIVHPYNDTSIPPGCADIKVAPVSIGAYCMIGYGSAIMPGVKIGNNCIVGANSVVTHDLPDGSVAVGNPARIIKRYNNVTQIWEKTDGL